MLNNLTSQQPSNMGIDIVMHSCSKYLGGHCDIIMGSVATNDTKMFNAIKKTQILRGASPSPFDCYMLQRSLYTLEVKVLSFVGKLFSSQFQVRMDRHHESALKVAKYLQKHPGVEKVIHPLLPEHPSHDLAMTQHKGKHSGMLSIYVKGGGSATKEFLQNLELFSYAVSLGGAHSLVCLPTK